MRIQEADFDIGAELAALQGERTDVGAIASFVGWVRGHTREDDIRALALEHYPGMTERAIEAMVVEAEKRFAVLAALVIHRVGRLLPGERIVLVTVASSHRHDAFQACEFLMDYLKTQAPFRKKEATARWSGELMRGWRMMRRWGAGGRFGQCGGWAGWREWGIADYSCPVARERTARSQPAGGPAEHFVSSVGESMAPRRQ